MSPSTAGPTARWPGRPSRWATAAAAALGLSVVATGTAQASPHGAAAPVVTRAALDPALVAGRGAAVDFTEQEAENAVTNGTLIGPGRSAYTLAAEASAL